MRIKEVTPAYLRMAMQSAVGNDHPATTPEFTEYVAKFLNGLVETSSPEVNRFRNLIKEVSRKTISSEQTAQFLELFGDELNAFILQAEREFVRKHFGGGKK